MIPKEICPICYQDSLIYNYDDDRTIITCEKCYYKHTISKNEGAQCGY